MMIRKNKSLILLIICLLVLGCSTQGKIVLSNLKPMASQLTKENTKYVVNKPIDLGGKTITFPKGAKVVFKGSGRISNGKIIGNEPR